MKNLIRSAVVTLIAASTAQAQQAVQWRVQDGGNGHWYARVSAGPGLAHWPFDAARSSAVSLGGQLASFETLPEGVAVYGLLGIAGLPPRDAGWIGLFQDRSDPSYSEPSGGWKWVSGAALGYAFWADGSPDNAGCENPSNAQEWGKWTGGQALGDVYARWDDEGNPTSSCPFGTVHAIVEWSADCNGDGVVDYGQCRDGSLPDYNGNNIPDCCEAGSPCVVGNYPVQWPVQGGGNGHWYQRRAGEVLEWLVAAERSRQLGGHLASITTAAENDFVAGVAYQSDFSSKMGPLLGGFKDEFGQFRWVTGEPFVFAAFGPGEPNGGLSEPYLHFKVYGSPGAPAWNDWWGAGPYLVEWSADCNNDGIVDKGQILQGQLPDINDNGIPDPCEQPTCRNADLLADRNVNGVDLGILLGQWGPNTQYTISDINSDGVVDGSDLGLLLSFWGPCHY